MKAVPYNENEHYAMLASWWESWGWGIIPTQALPKSGIVVFSDCNTPLCGGFIYKTDSCIAWIEQIVSNKQASKTLRSGCVEFLIKELSKLAINLGHTIAMTSVSHQGLIDKLIKNGYNKTDLNMTNLLKVL